MATLTRAAPSTGLSRFQSAAAKALAGLEARLDAEREQLPLWLPVMLGAGVTAWFVLPAREGWIGVLLGAGGLVCAGAALGGMRRTGRALVLAGAMLALGCGLAWWRAGHVAAPVLTRPVVAAFEGRVEKIERRVARDDVRVTLATDGAGGLPPRVRATIDADKAPEGWAAGDRLRLRARLVPPPEPALPGAYDFARVAWFQGLGGTGTALGTVERLGEAPGEPGLRDRLTAHVRSRIEGSAGGIAAAFATGDRGGIAAADEEAMRASGLAHLLSISGLHVTAVVAAAMLLALKLLALSPALALRWPLITVAAGVGAAAGVGYTLLTGAEVPTVRSCIAALLVLIGIALGREALTLRLVATGAIVVLLLWPESLMGPSFQLSFAAITAIVALHEHPRIRALLQRRDEGPGARGGRLLLGLLLTGIAVEVALAPIALFHFHKSGLYGALANIVAIPLTTFVIMPLEALALLFDTAGLGVPLWWLTGLSLELLIGLAHVVAAAPGAVAALPSVPTGAFALMVAGGLWLLLWKTGWRSWGFVPLAIGAGWAAATPAPDLLVTGDGRHMAVRGADGRPALLRARAGDYVRDLLAERAGETGDLGALDATRDARCTADLCRVDIARGGRSWRIVATRSGYRLPWRGLVETCATADIVVSDRRLPDACRPRWFKADRAMLRRTGGLAVTLSSGHVETVRRPGDLHPWVVAQAQ